jgi:hypothetical protein
VVRRRRLICEPQCLSPRASSSGSRAAQRRRSPAAFHLPWL